LLCIDRSERSIKALDFVAKFIKNSHHKIVLAHIVRGLEGLKNDPNGFAQANNVPDELNMTMKSFERVKTQMMNFLDECALKLENRGVDSSRIQTKIVSEEHSRSAAIIRTAQVENCGTIALGRKGLSENRNYAMGKVCNKVLFMAQEKTIWII